MRRRAVPVWASLLALALALGGFGIGTTELAGMGVLPDIAGDLGVLNHLALNVSNALGAWLGGVVIAAGLGYPAPAVVGAVLAVLGLVVLGASVVVERRGSTRADIPPASPLARQAA